MAGPGAGLQRYLPVVSWVRAYRLTSARGDVLGALTAWAIVVDPLGVDRVGELVIAVALSLTLFIGRASAPDLVALGRTSEGRFEHVGLDSTAQEVPGFLIIRPSGGLWFGNVERVRKSVVAMAAARPGRPRPGLVLVLTASFRLSLPVLDSLCQLEQQLRGAGSALWLVGVPNSARQELERDELYERLGAEHVVPTIDEAVSLTPHE